jgi:hypothetical protein
MDDRAQWLIDLESASAGRAVDGLVAVTGYKPDGRSPEEVAMMEKALAYKVHSVFFEAGRNGRPPIAQAFVFVSNGPADDLQFAELHKRLWSWGGVLSMLQQYNFLYNQQSLHFRRRFMATWDVREVLDFISVRGLFHKGGADTKVVVVVAGATAPSTDRKILHATFRRSGRIDAEQGFDIDYYDLHWLPRELVLSNDGVWRTDLLGGGRVLSLVDRLKTFRTLGQYAEDQAWEYGEGFIEGTTGSLNAAPHITGKKLLPSVALTNAGIDRKQITTATGTRFKSPYTRKRFTPPMLLIRENMDLSHEIWEDHYLTYKAQLVGICAPDVQRKQIRDLGAWLKTAKRPLQAFVAAISPSLFSRRATAIGADEIFALPYPEAGTLDLSTNEQIIINDIVDHYRELIRLGEDAPTLASSSRRAAFAGDGGKRARSPGRARNKP